jgi:hypothetical protein
VTVKASPLPLRHLPKLTEIHQSPAKDMLIENIYWNWSGGCAMGYLGTGTGISIFPHPSQSFN